LIRSLSAVCIGLSLWVSGDHPQSRRLQLDDRELTEQWQSCGPAEGAELPL